MGQLILKAQELGFTLISYDYNGSNSSAERELNAANIIKTKVFNKDPNAKIIIHCGYGHINEDKKLAAKLQNILNIDPLTINQTDVVEKTSSQLESNIYQKLSQKISGIYPVLLVDNNGEWLSLYNDKYDVNVIWPRTEMNNGRPNWAKIGRKSKLLNGSLCDAFPCVVESYIENSTNASLPIDRIIFTTQDEQKDIFYNGNLNIRVTGM